MTRDFCLSDQVFKLGNVIVSLVAFHFRVVKFISGLLYLSSMGEGELKQSLEIVPESFQSLGDLVIILCSDFL